MTVAVYRFAQFGPRFPHPDNYDPEPDGSVQVSRPAPEDVDRNELLSKISIPLYQPNNQFRALSVRHDEVGHYDAYHEPDTDDVTRQHYVCPKNFPAYEQMDVPGQVYARASIQILKEIFRRYRGTLAPTGEYRQRTLDLRGLEGTLQAAEDVVTSGLVLRNVQSQRPVTRMAIQGLQIPDNPEVQDLKDRAEFIRTLEFIFEHNGGALQMGIDDNASIKFARSPGDAPSLEVMSRLEPYIRQHSELVTVAVGQGGGG